MKMLVKVCDKDSGRCFQSSQKFKVVNFLNSMPNKCFKQSILNSNIKYRLTMAQLLCTSPKPLLIVSK